MIDNLYLMIGNLFQFIRDTYNNIKKFKELPAKARSAILYLLFSWIWVYISMYRLLKGDVPVQFLYMILCGVVLLFLMFSFKKWARVLSLTFNAMIICLYLVFAAAFFIKGQVEPLIITCVTIIFCSISTYYLMIKETTGLYKGTRVEDKPAVKEKENIKRVKSLKNRKPRQ